MVSGVVWVPGYSMNVEFTLMHRSNVRRRLVALDRKLSNGHEFQDGNFTRGQVRYSSYEYHNFVDVFDRYI